MTAAKERGVSAEGRSISFAEFLHELTQLGTVTGVGADQRRHIKSSNLLKRLDLDDPELRERMKLDPDRNFTKIPVALAEGAYEFNLIGLGVNPNTLLVGQELLVVEITREV